ncbi:right-handed parallel beta-helix repeat-containing protein [Actinomyces howellii]|uniref:Nitrous oxide reductase family maturation protein NosD n=1 Tax=Actinomyces howellii TaxID=52771 RepID=A0A448HF22_9ACTO|nr:right-handed parallel beta-helix repeat-containing protein [Actinomyces howellii]VEG26819.1 nitrous oxide reductase family maturation protein NosD [Actinomyces howellii]
MRRLIAIAAAAITAIALPLTASTALAEPDGATLYVSASAAQGGDGSAARPFATISEAVAAASDGTTIEVADGTYREGEIYVGKDVTIRAADGASPVLSGAQLPTSWSASGSGTWSTAADMVRFCTVCTTNADPSVEGMAAHPEQVFVDGQPLTQVATRAEVTASTFYVEDPDPITLKDPRNNTAGYNVKPHRGASYVIGVDPSQHTVEVTQHSRALSLAGNGVTLTGMTVEKYAPVQRWDYNDPEISTATGGAMVVASGDDVELSNNTFRHSSAGTAMVVSQASRVTVTGNSFVSNGGVGAGVDDSSDVVIENNYWTDNNTAGFTTSACTAYCSMADLKTTHSQNIRYAYNTVDYSAVAADHSEVESFETNRMVGAWFDEGTIDSEIIASSFVNTPVAIFNEVSRNNVIASNLVEGANIGIQISGSESTQVWNNTITHALTSIVVQEDGRSDGCMAHGADGTCHAVESWSASQGLTWDTGGTTIYNNILSSEQTIAEGDFWKYSAMVQVTGGEDTNGSGGVYANQMIAAIDYNVYYREPTTNPSTTVLWQYGVDRAAQTVNAPTLADFAASPHVQAQGKETNGLDLSGTRETNPVLVRESADATAWKTSDLHAADGGPGDGTGAALPTDVAEVLGLSAGGAVDRGALVNVAWQADGAAAGAAAPAAPAAQEQPAAAAAAQATPSDEATILDGAQDGGAVQAGAAQAPAGSWVDPGQEQQVARKIQMATVVERTMMGLGALATLLLGLLIVRRVWFV